MSLVAYGADSDDDDDDTIGAAGGLVGYGGDDDDDEESALAKSAGLPSAAPGGSEDEQGEGLAQSSLLPPQPKGLPADKVREKVNKLLHLAAKFKLQHPPTNINIEVLERKRALRNPSIYKKLIEMMDIDETGTNCPTELYDPNRWSNEDFLEGLKKSQQSRQARIGKEKQRRTEVQFVSVTASANVPPPQRAGGAPEQKKVRKWDQTASSSDPVATAKKAKAAELLKAVLAAKVATKSK